MHQGLCDEMLRVSTLPAGSQLGEEVAKESIWGPTAGQQKTEQEFLKRGHGSIEPAGVAGPLKAKAGRLQGATQLQRT